MSLQMQQSEAAELPAEIKTAQRRVTRAIAELEPPGGFSVLIECMAQEIVASGIAGSPLYGQCMQMQVGALMQRVRGVCDELGVEIPEAPVPAPKTAWWRRLVSAT